MSLSVYAANKLHESDMNDAWTKLFDFVPEGARVLDVGCSTGNFGAELIKRKKCKVVGIDIGRDDLEVAQNQLTKALLINIETDSVGKLGKFDVIFMADIIEHLLKPVDALLKLRAILKDGGILVFSVPNMSNIAVRMELLIGRFEYTSYGLLDETHVHYYDRVELENVLGQAGFSVREYNCTLRDAPRSMLEEQLKKAGLTASKKFWKLAEDIDARAFQFIGVATLGGETAHVKLGSKTPYDFINKQFETLRSEYEASVQKLASGELDVLSADQATLLSLRKSLDERGGSIRHLEGLVKLQRKEIFELKQKKSKNFLRRFRKK